MCICIFTLLLYVFHTHTDLWDSTPPPPVVRHVCGRLTDLSSNQTSFRLHLTPSPREQPPQWRSPGNHPLISEVSVCIIVFTLSSDTQSLAQTQTSTWPHTHSPTVTYSHVLRNIFKTESASVFWYTYPSIRIHCTAVRKWCQNLWHQQTLENHLCSPAKVNIWHWSAIDCTAWRKRKRRIHKHKE